MRITPPNVRYLEQGAAAASGRNWPIAEVLSAPVLSIFERRQRFLAPYP